MLLHVSEPAGFAGLVLLQRLKRIDPFDATKHLVYASMRDKRGAIRCHRRRDWIGSKVFESI